MMNDHDNFDKWLKREAEKIPVPDPAEFWPGTEKALRHNYGWKSILGSAGFIVILGALLFTYWPSNSEENVYGIDMEDVAVSKDPSAIDTQEIPQIDVGDLPIETNTANVDIQQSNTPIIGKVSSKIKLSQIEPKVLDLATENTAKLNETASDILNSSVNPKENAVSTLSDLSENSTLDLLAENSANPSLEDYLDAEDVTTSLDDNISVASDVEEEDELITDINAILPTSKSAFYTQFQLGYFANFRPTYGFQAGMSYDFNQNWGITAGLGIQIINKLNFQTTLTRIDYSFDRINQEYQMEMHDLLYASLPITLMYRRKRHAIHLGGVIHRAVQARAALTTPSGETTTEWGSADPAQLWHGSVLVDYRYAIDRNWQIGILCHFNQNHIIMNTNDFRSLQLQIIKWW